MGNCHTYEPRLKRPESADYRAAVERYNRLVEDLHRFSAFADMQQRFGETPTRDHAAYLTQLEEDLRAAQDLMHRLEPVAIVSVVL